MIYENKFTYLYPQLDEVAKFIKFGRKEIVGSIKNSLEGIIEIEEALANNYNKWMRLESSYADMSLRYNLVKYFVGKNTTANL